MYACTGYAIIADALFPLDHQTTGRLEQNIKHAQLEARVCFVMMEARS
jgi:hypothetical protein